MRATRSLALALALAACGAPATTPTAGGRDEAPQVAAVRRGSLADRVVLTGELAPAPAGTVNLQVPSIDRDVAIRWLAEDGSHVEAGDRVIELDNSAFTEGLEQKHLASLEAETTARNASALATIALADKKSELAQHQIELDKAKLKASIPADLVAAHDAQEAELEKRRAETAVEKAQRDLDAAKNGDALDGKVRELARDKAKRAVDEAERTIHELIVTAPVAGTVVIADHPWEGRKFQVGDSMWPGFTVARIPDATHAMQVHADLSDVDDGRVTVGMTGTCTLDAYPDDAQPCTVTDLTPVARDKGKTSLRRVFAVVLELASRDQASHQRPGMSVKVVLARKTDGVLLVPRGAVAWGEAGKPAHVRLAGGELREAVVTACDAQACAVGSGVAEGDRVQW